MMKKNLRKVKIKRQRMKTEKQNTITEIKANYKRRQESYIAELFMSFEKHRSTEGGYREDTWARMLREILPKKFSIATNGFIIDAKGHRSKEIDIIIYDEMYVPYVFQYGEVAQIIPVEAVVAVVQCKSKILNKSNLNEWVKSIRSVKTTSGGQARTIHGLVKENEKKEGEDIRETKPLIMLCCLDNNEVKTEIKDMFDIVVSITAEQTFQTDSWMLNNSKEDVMRYLNNGFCKSKFKSDTSDWDAYEKLRKEQPLIFLSMFMNQIIMLINNPMFFNHDEYAQMFV